MKPFAKVLIFLFLGILSFLLVLVVLNNKWGRAAQQKNLKTVGIRDTKIYVEVADTADKKSKGLSTRRNLDKTSGMLFIFPKETEPTFWMKDMLFPIDIIWIQDGKISQIDKKVPNPPVGTADSQLLLYRPAAPIDYVLEVNSGFSDKNGLEVGDVVDLSSI